MNTHLSTPNTIEKERVLAVLDLIGCRSFRQDSYDEIYVSTYICPNGERKSVWGIVYHTKDLVSEISSRVAELKKYLRNTSESDACDAFLYLGTDAAEALDQLEQGPPEIDGVALCRIDDVVSDAFLESRLHRVYAQELADAMGDRKRLPVPCVVKQGNSIRGVDASDAFEVLNDFFENTTLKTCCVVGSFGQGKSVLLRRLCEQLSGSTSVVPLKIDVGGVGSGGLENAISRQLGDMFGCSDASDLEGISQALGSKLKVVLLFDSLDEQTELSPKEISTLVSKILNHCERFPKSVIALRPELVDGKAELLNLIFRSMEDRNIAYQTVNLLPVKRIHGEELITRLNRNNRLSVSNKMLGLVTEFVRRPLWGALVESYIETATQRKKIKVVEIMDWCLVAWARRELRTDRPFLNEHQRSVFTCLLALCIHSGLGIETGPAKRIHRRDLLRFVERVLPKLSEIEPHMQFYLRWANYSTEVTAESLAVANLMTIDDDGTMGFSEELVFIYYLALCFHDVLSSAFESYGSEGRILDLFGLQYGDDLFGVSQVPRSVFFEMMQELTSVRKVSGGVSGRLTALLEGSRDFLGGKKFNAADTLFNDELDMLEEGRSYEIKIPKNWPRIGAWNTAGNVAKLLAQDGGTVEDIALESIDFHGADLAGLKFVGCNFRGADLSHCNLTGASFTGCDLEYTLFHRICGDLGSVKLERCKLENTLFTDSIFEEQYGSSLAVDTLSRLCGDNESFAIPSESVILQEHCGIPIKVPVLFFDRKPITCKDFHEFVDSTPNFSRECHAWDIENQYYLAWLERARAADKEYLPIVWVSLIAAVSYAVSKGKRLPSLAEYHVYADALGSDIHITGDDLIDYWELPIKSNQEIGVGVVTEWTIQIDDEEYWQSAQNKSGISPCRSICCLPPFRRNDLRRCEYFVAGRSYLKLNEEPKNSKPATWINPDQGFRCVRSYTQVALKALEQRHSNAKSL